MIISTVVDVIINRGKLLYISRNLNALSAFSKKLAPVYLPLLKCDQYHMFFHWNDPILIFTSSSGTQLVPPFVYFIVLHWFKQWPPPDFPFKCLICSYMYSPKTHSLTKGRLHKWKSGKSLVFCQTRPLAPSCGLLVYEQFSTVLKPFMSLVEEMAARWRCQHTFPDSGRTTFSRFQT